MRVLASPDKFRGTLTARQAAEAIEHGWLRARPGDHVDLLPLADGGEGSLDVLAPADDPAVRRLHVVVSGPLGDPIDAELAVRAGVGVVEIARACGLQLLGSERLDPRHASSVGTGELMEAARRAGATRVLVCLGGSATNDGGVGMASALGGRFLDATGQPVGRSPIDLPALARIDLGVVHRVWRSIEVIGVTDVDNPLCGPAGASAVFGPQKGASPEGVFELDRALAHLAAVAAHDLGVDRSREPGAGAAGGLGFGLLAFLGGKLRPGVDVVMEAVGFEERLQTADVVITGEGSFDAQSLRGKVPAGVLAAAARAGVPAAVACGVASVEVDGVVVRSLVDRVGHDAAMTDARRSLELVAADLAEELAR